MALRLFGNLVLDDPKDHLSTEQQAWLERVLPLIRNLEENRQGRSDSSWNIHEEFERFREREIAWWKSRNVDRHHFLVRPSGRVNASVACQLFNPTFTVHDPTLETTFDLSNASMVQLRQAGTSLEECLVS